MLRVVKVLRQRNISSNALDIAEVKTNKEQCKRLARRAKEALIDIDKCMEGKWEAAPQGLLDNVMKLIEALDSIHSFMVKPTEKKWLKRFMSKSAIESELTEYTQRLEDVKQRFLVRFSFQFSCYDNRPEVTFGFRTHFRDDHDATDDRLDAEYHRHFRPHRP